jgi:hypothetical protein
MELEQKIQETSTKIDVHLAECALRYSTISDALTKGAKKMTQLQWAIWALAVSVFLGPGFAAEFLKSIFIHH